MPVVVVDAGDLLWKAPVVPPSERAQVEIKADLIAEAYALGGLDAMVPGEGELALGVDTFLSLVDKYKLPVVAANLRCGDRTFPDSRLVERAGRRIGIVGVTDEAPEGCELTRPPADGLRAGLAELGVGTPGAPDLVIGLVHGTSATDRQLTQQVAGLDFLVNGHQRMGLRSPNALEGGTWELGAGSRGKTLGILELEFVDGAAGWRDVKAAEDLEQRLKSTEARAEAARTAVSDAADASSLARAQRRVEYFDQQLAELRAQLDAASSEVGATSNRYSNLLAELSDEVDEEPAIEALVQKAKAAITAGGESVAVELPATLEGTPFAGSGACQGCHPGETKQWTETAHARAYLSLVNVDRHMDAACFSCHVTGAFHPAGPKTGPQARPLRDVGCESCHGPGASHALSPSKENIVRGVSEATCTSCHDGVQDEGRFNYDDYLPKVVHSAGG